MKPAAAWGQKVAQKRVHKYYMFCLAQFNKQKN